MNKSNYLNHEHHDIYLENQRAETGGAGVDTKYLNYLTTVELPEVEFDYTTAAVLDVGCGNFASYDYFMSKFNLPITGIEISTLSIEYGRLNDLPILNIDAHLMDEHFNENEFDLLISFHSLEHMLDMPLVLSNCYNTLKPGGYFFFALPIPVAQLTINEGHWYPCDTPAEMVEHVNTAGFEIINYFMSANGQFREGSEFVCLTRKPL